MRRPRGRSAVIAGVAIVAIAVLVGAVGFVALGAGRDTPSHSLGPPHFTEETATAGLAQMYDGPLAYFTGGGIAVFDCDRDGRPDAYVAGGTNPAALFHNDSATGGELRFSAIHSAVTDLTSVTGAYPLDVDGDGNVDLAVLRIGGNEVLRGLGGCRFEAANDRWGIDGGTAATMAFAATWERDATLPTLAFGNYLDPAATDPKRHCSSNVLVRPAPGAARYASPTELAPGYCALSMLFSDWDRSGRRDLRISNDAHYYVDGEEQLWRIEPGVAPSLYTGDQGWVRVNVEGMGIATYDLTGDGYPEVFLTSQGENRLQTLTAGASQPTYRDIGLKRGVSADRPFTGGDPLPSTAWHPEFEDVNNDGFIDLFISKGNVRQQEGYAMRDPSNLLLGQPDGTFTEAADAAGILSYDLGRGAALADFNLDGLLDLVEVNLGSPVRLWRNTGSGSGAAAARMGTWLAMRLHQPAPNVDAIGSWLEVKVGDTTMRREVTVGGGHGGGQLGPIHVGTGSARSVDVRAIWPDGTAGAWTSVATNQLVELDRSTDTARPWTPPAAP